MPKLDKLAQKFLDFARCSKCGKSEEEHGMFSDHDYEEMDEVPEDDEVEEAVSIGGGLSAVSIGGKKIEECEPCSLFDKTHKALMQETGLHESHEGDLDRILESHNPADIPYGKEVPTGPEPDPMNEGGPGSGRKGNHYDQHDPDSDENKSWHDYDQHVDEGGPGSGIKGHTTAKDEGPAPAPAHLAPATDMIYSMLSDPNLDRPGIEQALVAQGISPEDATAAYDHVESNYDSKKGPEPSLFDEPQGDSSGLSPVAGEIIDTYLQQDPYGDTDDMNWDAQVHMEQDTFQAIVADTGLDSNTVSDMINDYVEQKQNTPQEVPPDTFDPMNDPVPTNTAGEENPFLADVKRKAKGQLHGLSDKGPGAKSGKGNPMVPDENEAVFNKVHEALMKEASDENWITVRGNHIKIEKGQTKDQAVKNFLSKQKGGKGGGKKTAPSKTEIYSSLPKTAKDAKGGGWHQVYAPSYSGDHGRITTGKGYDPDNKDTWGYKKENWEKSSEGRKQTIMNYLDKNPTKSFDPWSTMPDSYLEKVHPVEWEQDAGSLLNHGYLKSGSGLSFKLESRQAMRDKKDKVFEDLEETVVDNDAVFNKVHEALMKETGIQEADDDIEWITVNGAHIPIKKGQTKGDAVNDFFEQKEVSARPKVRSIKKLVGQLTKHPGMGLQGPQGEHFRTEAKKIFAKHVKAGDFGPQTEWIAQDIAFDGSASPVGQAMNWHNSPAGQKRMAQFHKDNDWRSLHADEGREEQNVYKYERMFQKLAELDLIELDPYDKKEKPANQHWKLKGTAKLRKRLDAERNS